jgi:hypothetical protein
MGLLAIAFWALVVGITLLRKYFGKPTNVTLLPYQRGVLYKKGIPVRELGPGTLRVWAGMEKVIVIDTRPIQLSFENRAVALTDGTTAVYGFSGSVEIRDLRKALYSSQNYNQIPAYVFLCCSRMVLNACSSGQIKTSQGTIEQEISDKARERLGSQGFELQSFRLTQLALAAPAPPRAAAGATSGAN